MSLRSFANFKLIMSRHRKLLRGALFRLCVNPSLTVWHPLTVILVMYWKQTAVTLFITNTMDMNPWIVDTSGVRRRFPRGGQSIGVVRGDQRGHAPPKSFRKYSHFVL